jgi:DNA-binding NarL/FixJ family response regulator
VEPELIQLLIVDDHEPLRRGLVGMVRATPDMRVVGEAGTGAEAVALADALQPDVVLMDLQMPDGGGLEATRRIVAAHPHIRVLVLTMHDDDDSVFTALQAGARGYLLKGALKGEILRAIRVVYSGEAIFGPSVAQRLVSYFAALKTSAAAYPFPELTEREREILGLVAQRLGNQAIAERLMLSEKTVRNNISNIFTKLQVADRTEAIRRAHEAGLNG